MTDLKIANMLADYHKECEAAETLREKADVQLKHARLIREALRQPPVSGCCVDDHIWQFGESPSYNRCVRCGFETQ